VALRVGLGLLVLGGVAIALAWGWNALVVYAFFAAISGGLGLAAGVGGDWIRDSSRGRFDRKDR
jgi:hypothetical protein